MTDVSSIAAIPTAARSATGLVQKAVRAVEKDAAVVAKSQQAQSRAALDAMIDARQQVLYTRAAAKIIDASNEVTKGMLDMVA